jgi:hypothetical protein
MRASFERIARLVEAVGLERVREPYIKHLEDRIWEIRLGAATESPAPSM